MQTGLVVGGAGRLTAMARCSGLAGVTVVRWLSTLSSPRPRRTAGPWAYCGWRAASRPLASLLLVAVQRPSAYPAGRAPSW